MTNIEKAYRWAGVAVFLTTLGIYLKTMAPSVSFWDCGEFIACSFTMSVPHPPGSPLYVLLGRVFSLVPIGEVAARITFMSVLSSALAIWCVYLSTVALARRALGGASLTPFNDSRDIAVLAGSVLAALSLAFSYTQWYNATEAEVYGYSIFFTCVGLWIILYWEGTQHGARHDRWLYLIAYMFGLGGGLHLLCLLTIPSLMILAWFADEKLRRLILLLLGFGLAALLVLALSGSGMTGKLLIGVGLIGLLYYLYGHDRRAGLLLGGVLLLFALGYSTYTALYIRSGLNPVIDENDPETIAAFIKFLNREQYGTESMLLTMLSGRASRLYQFWHLQAKYFFQQFPFPLLERIVIFRKATDPSSDVVLVSVVPYLLGLGGLIWHAVRDWKRFLAMGSLFLIMGVGLSLYLNMPDPQPRERHYVFGGMYLAFALWMGLGWTGIVDWVRQRLGEQPLLVGAVGLFGLLLPVGIGINLYHVQDRTGDYIAYDYAYNLLESCDEDGILFTNGDNDTFPVWFLQEVEGVRKDVRVVNLSLLNTNWYIKQLRDREPKVDIRYSDTFIDSVLTDTQQVDILKRYIPEPRPVSVAGLDFELRDFSGYSVLRIQDIMILKILEWNEWKRPIHFAITIPANNRLGLDDFMTMDGMAFTLTREKFPQLDVERMTDRLYETFQLRALKDPEVYKDENTARLLGNYRAVISYLGEYLRNQGEADKLIRLLRWSDAHLPLGWESYYTSALDLQEVDRLEEATEFMEKAAYLMLETATDNPVATYENLIALADIIQERYGAFDRAEPLYRRFIELDPGRYEAHYGLAASLQKQGRTREGIKVVESYIAGYGEHEKMVEALQILRNALAQEGEE